MDKIINYIEQNPVIAVTAAAVLIFLAGFIARKFKAVAFVLVLIAAFGFFTLLKANKFGKAKIEEVNKAANAKIEEVNKAGKTKVGEIKNKVKTKVMENMK